MLLAELRKKYADNEPIYLEDAMKVLGVTSSYCRILMSTWVKNNQLKRFERGVYYFPKASKLFGEAAFDTQKVIEDKYLGTKEEPLGYYADFTLANMVGITTQVPAKTIIVTNNESGERRREVKIGNQKLLISRPKKLINKDNVMALMLLDLVSVANKYSELSRKETIEIVKRFAANAKVTWRQIKDNIDAYPTRVSQELIKMEIYDVLA